MFPVVRTLLVETLKFQRWSRADVRGTMSPAALCAHNTNKARSDMIIL
jgi:hypothetical protein